ncbi:hypothetical protein niasHT_015197 [Heterodera trifolii]|uniref:Uncharacterized protein n=1 Tax=Heterodera trifolii TaxID=157864 RepID=A0ABD2L2B1_9BILA
MSPTNALVTPPPTQPLAPSLVSIASPTTDNSGTWLSSGFDVGIIILLFLILILVTIVLCLLCRLFYRTRQQQFVPSNIVPSPTVSSPRMPSASVPLTITNSVPMSSSSAADHLAQSQIPIQTLVSLQHQCGAIPMPKCCSSSSDHSPCPIPIQILAPSLRHDEQYFLPSPSIPYADDHHRPQVIAPSCSASPFHDHRAPKPIGRAVPFPSICGNQPIFSPPFGAHSTPWECYECEYMYEYHFSEEYFKRK